MHQLQPRVKRLVTEIIEAAVHSPYIQYHLGVRTDRMAQTRQTVYAMVTSLISMRLSRLVAVNYRTLSLNIPVRSHNHHERRQ